MFPFFLFLVCLISVFNDFQQVRMMIDEALFRYSADKTGLADFGLESAGKYFPSQHAILGHLGPLLAHQRNGI